MKTLLALLLLSGLYFQSYAQRESPRRPVQQAAPYQPLILLSTEEATDYAESPGECYLNLWSFNGHVVTVNSGLAKQGRGAVLAYNLQDN
ncbi:MAG TPA: hypothetical protein VD927_03140 [Chryseosolibacter sp.]|nr:hypothetical protein [Chryseosolibacter sp.]